MLKSLQNNWNTLTNVQRAAVVAVLVAVFGGILMLAVSTGRPNYAVLYSKLSPEDAGTVTAKLKDLKVEYRLSGEGQAIEVPADKVYELRNTLAMEGLPRNGTIGFELWDKQTLGATEKTQDVNYQRALQGELTRTLQNLEGVTEAKVLIALTKKPLFTQKEDPVTAMVVLHLRSGYRMSERQVAGVIHLVSHAVERLLPENVSVHDSEGNQLNLKEGSADLTTGQLTFQVQEEHRLSSELQSLANQIFGPGRSAIHVSVEMDWDQSQSTNEIFTPSSTRGDNLIVEEKNNIKGFSKLGDKGNTPGTFNFGLPVISELKPGDYKDYDVSTTRVVNKKTETRRSAFGKIKRRSVAIFVDNKITIDKAALSENFATGAGLDLTPVKDGGRGDKISLLSIAFDTSVQDKEKAEELAAAKQAQTTNLVRNGAALGTLLLVGVLTLLMARKPSNKPKKARRGRLDATIADAPGPALEGSDPDGMSIGDGGSLDPRNLLSDGPIPLEEENLDTALGRIRSIAADQPEEVALMLQDWLRGPSKPLR